MTGDLDMGMKKILNVDTLNDYTDNSEKDKDLKSVVNKRYLNTHFLKIMGKGDNDFNLGGQIIKNCEPYYDGLFDDNSLVSKPFVDAEIAKIPKAATDVLKLDGSKSMTGDLNMNNNEIKNLKDPQAGDNAYAATVNFVNKTINNSNTIISTLIDKKIKESEKRSIESIDKENVFKRVMDNDEFKEDDSAIHDKKVVNKDYHSIDKKTYEFKIDYDSSDGIYSTRLEISLIYLPIGYYTMVYEMYIDDGLTVDQIDAIGDSIHVEKINSKIDGTNTRSIIQLHKQIVYPDSDDLNIDIKFKGKTDPQTTIYVVVYGVKGYVNDVSVNLWDRFYYYDNDYVQYKVSIDMNNKDITGVNKITTGNLDVNGQIDVKGNKITGVADGTENSDAINKKQLSVFTTQFVNSILQNHNNIITIQNSLTKLKYYYFTDQLQHENRSFVFFPNNINKYPFGSGNGNDKFKILLSGHYHIIYTDYYKNKGQFRI